MAYIPGAGIKKPLNMMENPVYPDIKRGPPRFVWSGKHWKVDAGATMRDTEPITQFYEDAVLAVSHDYNQNVYGKSSHRDIVNAAFRPPLLDPYTDFYPLNRIPCTRDTIIPHINPGTAHDGYRAKNERTNNVESALTDRVQKGELQPTFYCPLSQPQDNSVLPDLETKLPSVSATAGWNVPLQIDAHYSNPIYPDLRERLETPIASGKTTSLKIDGNTPFESLHLNPNRPGVSVSSGATTSLRLNGETPEIELQTNRPNVSVSSGATTNLRLNGETPEIELHPNRPNVSVSSGATTNLRLNGETPEIELHPNRPNISASSGATTKYTTPIDIHEVELVTHLGATPINVNPGTNLGTTGTTSLNEIDTVENCLQTPISISAVAVPKYSVQDNSTNRIMKPRFRKRLETAKSYGHISQSSPNYPTAGASGANMNLRSILSRENSRKIAYRF